MSAPRLPGSDPRGADHRRHQEDVGFDDDAGGETAIPRFAGPLASGLVCTTVFFMVTSLWFRARAPLPRHARRAAPLHPPRLINSIGGTG